MVDYDVLIEKVNAIQNCLSRIHSKTQKSLDSLDDWDVQDIVVLNLQRAIQLSIDIAFHIVSTEKLGLPQTLKESFSILEKEGIISKELAEKMEKMVGFRNIAVHDYETIEPSILKSIVKKHLNDFETFYSKILTFYQDKKG